MRNIDELPEGFVRARQGEDGSMQLDLGASAVAIASITQVAPGRLRIKARGGAQLVAGRRYQIVSTDDETLDGQVHAAIFSGCAPVVPGRTYLVGSIEIDGRLAAPISSQGWLVGVTLTQEELDYLLSGKMWEGPDDQPLH